MLSLDCRWGAWMYVDVVSDGPPGRRLRVAWRRAPTIFGAVLVCVGATVVLPLIFLSLAVGFYLIAWIDFQSHPEKVWPDWFQDIRGSLVPIWISALVVTVTLFVVGFKLLRANRNLVLFLRRFGYRPATQAVTDAALRLGDFWRVVTLDDHSIEALDAGDRVESLIEVTSRVRHTYRSVAPAVTKAWRLLIRAALATVFIALAFTLIPGPNWNARVERITAIVNPDQDIPGGAAVAARIGAAAVVVGLALALVWFAIVVAGWLISFPARLIFGGVSRGVQDASRSDELHVADAPQLATAKPIVERQKHRVFGARLCVLTVNSNVWRETVAGMAEICAVPLIDISEPTENVLWEIGELIRQFGDRCVFIGEAGRVHELIEGEADDVTRQLFTFLIERHVLVYTAGAVGTKRFVRALSSTLDHHARRPLPPSRA